MSLPTGWSFRLLWYRNRGRFVMERGWSLGELL